jgi:hypothetical protein
MFAEAFTTVGDPSDPTFSAPIVKRRNETACDGDELLSWTNARPLVRSVFPISSFFFPLTGINQVMRLPLDTA